MKEITKSQIITIHTLLQHKGLMEEKANIVSEASGMRTSSCKELTFSEAQQLINILNGKKQENPNDKSQKMRKHIIAMAHELGFIKKEMKVMAEGGMKEVANYDDLHAWIAKFGHKNKVLVNVEAHKHLNLYSYKELPILVTQFKQVYNSKMGIK